MGDGGDGQSAAQHFTSTPYSDSPPVTFIEVEPFYKFALETIRSNVRAKVKACKGKFVFDPSSYGPPYVPNESLENALLEEVSGGESGGGNRKRLPSLSLRSVHECLSLQVDPNVQHPSDRRNRPLHYACRYGNVGLVRMLLRAGADVDKANGLGQTPLMIAAGGRKRRHASCVRELLLLLDGRSNNACDIELKDRGGSPALRQAILASNVASVRLLLERGASVAWDVAGGALGVTVTTGAEEETDDDDGVPPPPPPVALSFALFVRAKSVKMEVQQANDYFRRMEESRGGEPSRAERWTKKGLCSAPHVVVKLISEAMAARSGERKKVSHEGVSPVGADPGSNDPHCASHGQTGRTPEATDRAEKLGTRRKPRRRNRNSTKRRHYN